MRKFTLFIVFLVVCFSLYGQTSREFKIYVEPIGGFGREADNDYFYNRLIYEVTLQYHTIVKSKYGSDYTFKGIIEFVSDMPAGIELASVQTDINDSVPESPIPPVRNIYGRREFFSAQTGDKLYFYDSTGTDNRLPSLVQEKTSSETDDKEKGEKYYFKLEMIDNATDEVLGVQNFVFNTPDDSVNRLISVIIYNLLSDIPDVSGKRGDSRDRWLYFEISALWMPTIYYGGYENFNLLHFGMKIGAEFRFLKFMSLGAGVQITQDNIVTSVNEYSDLILETPVSLKGFFKIGNNFALEPYGGAAWNYSLEKTIQPSMFSWFAGCQFGIKDKSETGMFFIDPRFSMDFYDSVLPAENINYQRYSIQLGIGYKFGVIQRKK
jgi:hypothetical protein